MRNKVKTKPRITLKILVLLIAAAGAFFWANSLMASLNAYRSLLAAQPPGAGQPVGKTDTHRLVFVLIDGLRYDTAEQVTVMPFLNELRARGAWAKMHSRAPSYSQPGYTTLFTGAWPEMNDGPAINVPYDEIRAWSQDNLFSTAMRAGLKTAVSGYYWFEKLIPQSNVSASFYTPGEDQQADRQVVDHALPWLKDANLGLILIHLDQVDYAGHHEGGARDPNWQAAARRTDDLLREIVATLDLNQDTLVVVSDHGHLDRGGHGGQDELVLQEPFLLIGAGVTPGEFPDIAMVDVAPTLAALLGASLPASSQGQARLEMLNLDDQKANALVKAESAQQKQLLDTYSVALGQPAPESTAGVSPDVNSVVATQNVLETMRQSRLNRERVPRAVIGLAWLLLPALVFFRKYKLDKGWMLLGGFLYLALFNVGYVWLSGKRYSLSSVLSAGELILVVGILALIAFFSSGAFFIWRRKVRRRSLSQAVEATIDFTMVAAYLLSIPVMVSFVLNGPLVTWTLPDFFSSFVGFLSMIQILFVSIGGIILAGVAGLLVARNP
jgi:hypothetical protein